jgi:hypothetical protein
MTNSFIQVGGVYIYTHSIFSPIPRPQRDNGANS